MAQIDDKTMENVCLLAKLSLTETEKEAAKKEMQRMVEFMDVLKELDTEGVSPMSHVFPVANVFREDVVENGDDSQAMLQNAPRQREGQYQVPKTVEQGGV